MAEKKIDAGQMVREALERSLILNPGEPGPDCQPLPASGSARRYFRFRRTDGSTFLGVYHADAHENAAYLDFSRQFLAKGLPVPAILYVDNVYPVYFVADAGREALYDILQWLERRAETVSRAETAEAAGREGRPADACAGGTATIQADNEAIRRILYRRVIDRLIDFQYTGGQGFAYSAAYPYASFDEKAIYADLNYFKYYFLKLAGIPFDERALEADYQTLTAALGAAPRDVFMYRDFQSRNIQLGRTWPAPPADSTADLRAFAEAVPLTFIDFQGGRRGPAAYDLATLLYEAKAKLSPALRDDLLHYYMTRTATAHPYPAGRDFEADFYGFVFLRIFQAMGAYGLRGLYERKAVFLQSIPPAIANLARLADQGRLPQGLPEIARIIERLRHSHWAQAAEMATTPATPPTATAQPHAPTVPASNETTAPRPESADDADSHPNGSTEPTATLTVSVYSFSYRRGLPADLDASGNGGGFVFDCRGLPNPGRLPEYQQLTGRDASVQTYLQGFPQPEQFIEQAIAVTAFNIENYLQRGFTHLQVAFGCTGGQHRSVYCAEEYARRIRERYPVTVELRHIAHPA